MTGALDLWTLLIEYVFGGFWMAIAGLCAYFFIVMGVLGRMSVYSVTIYMMMFVLAMTLGYGFTTLNILITGALLLTTIFVVKGLFDSK